MLHACMVRPACPELAEGLTRSGPNQLVLSLSKVATKPNFYLGLIHRIQIMDRETMKVKLNDKGLVPAIAQDINTGQVLMLGYMNPGSLKRSVEGGQVWFYSRSQEDCGS